MNRLLEFFAGGTEVKGQVVFEPTSSDQTISWTVPVGVTSISMVCVSNAFSESSVTVGGTIVCRALNSGITGDGGGLGGIGGNPAGTGDPVRQTGGGGAAGYSGNGGNGVGTDSPSGAGNGGGGSGGSCVFVSGTGYLGFGGGGVGLKGIGASGASVTAAGGKGGSGGADAPGAAGALYGGGSAGNSEAPGRRGGALAYKNNVAVTPGQTITVKVPGFVTDKGAVRIMWGGGRSYPSNAGDV